MTGRPAAVLIAGGGVAALEAALALRALAEERVSVELLAPEHHFYYRPLAVAEPFELGEVQRFELAELAAEAGATFSPGELVSVDAPGHLAHTSVGTALAYDVLLIACGAIPKPAIPGAVTFRGPGDVEKVVSLLGELEAGDAKRLVFAAPWGASWSLPIYELALMTAAWLADRNIAGVELTLVTAESEPLGLFGAAASAAARELLDERGIALRTRTYAVELREGELHVVPAGPIAADRVVALPRLWGQRIDGVPQMVDGFIPVDAHGRVIGVTDVFAAGDITWFSVKQGGIAAQQAVAAAEAIAAGVRPELTPQEFRPVLRGLLLTGAEPRYLRQELADGADATLSSASPKPLWWPPAKIVGRYLAPFLAARAGVEIPDEVPSRPGTVPVEVELRSHDLDPLTARRPDLERSGLSVGDVMSNELMVVRSEDTLGSAAQKMLDRGAGPAIVVDQGRLIGILTSRDLLRAFAGRVHSGEARVRGWMTPEPLAVSAETTLEAAALMMTEYSIQHLPVVENRRPVGMVRLRDVARTAMHSPKANGLGF